MKIKRIENYERYTISEDGQVFDTKKNRPCKQSTQTNGYKQVSFNIGDGKRKHFLVHRLVGQAFIPNPENLPEINECAHK